MIKDAHNRYSVITYKKSKWKIVVLALIVLTGVWQLGQGVYIHLKAQLAQILLEQAWTRTLNGEQQVAPWPWADTWPIARLQVPRLEIDLIVLAGDSGRVLAFGPGHNFVSTMPGEIGNSFISGHRDTHFQFLQYLQHGDKITIETRQGGHKVFVVDGSDIVDADEASILSNENAARLSLITCYPFEALVPGGSQRYIVSAIEI